MLPRPKKMLTAHEAAEYLRVSRATMWRWCKTGRLPAFRIGREWRISVEELDRIVGDRTIASSGNAERSIRISKGDIGSEEIAEKEVGETPARILVVDDDKVVCNLLEGLLIETGYEVKSCLSGQEAISELQDDSFDLVITDMQMPEVNGLEVLRKAKELVPSCEVIVVTALAPDEIVVEVMKRGAYDCVGKPFNIDEIGVVVDKAIKKRRLVRVDGLTEVYDYRAFYELLEAEFARSERHPRPMSVLMMGLDDLKMYNDTFGRPAGDEVLKGIAWLLKRSLRQCDIVARHRRDEFAIILVETNKAGAISTANRLSRLVEESSFEHDDILPHKTLTISIGVAGYPTDAREKVELVTRAGQALCAAKTSGGNLVRTAKTLNRRADEDRS